MMKARFGDRSAKTIAVAVRALVKCNDQIERAAGKLALAGCNYFSGTVIFRSSDAAFVRVGGELLDQ